MSEDTRKKQIAFEATEEQLAVIAQAAASEGLAIASYVRRVALMAAKHQPVAA